MTLKENTRNMYCHRDIDVMPAPGEGEHAVYPVSGFIERPANNEGGLDWFGCNWIYSESSGAPAPDVHNHILKDVCDWKEVVKFPDLNAWDWEEARNIDHVEDIDRENKIVNVIVCNGLFERLHVLMGFEDALVALLTDTEAVEEFFDAMVDYKIKLITKLHEYYHPDVITFHDDWGTQRSMFFSPELWRELIKPRMKKIIDCAHSFDIGFIMHSCGKIQDIVMDIQEIGVDTLQCMDINDIGLMLKMTQGKMSIQASVHTQDFEVKDAAGLLTPEIVRETVHNDFLQFGESRSYFPFLPPVSKWYEEIVVEEYFKCRELLRTQ